MVYKWGKIVSPAAQSLTFITLRTKNASLDFESFFMSLKSFLINLNGPLYCGVNVDFPIYPHSASCTDLWLDQDILSIAKVPFLHFQPPSCLLCPSPFLSFGSTFSVDLNKVSMEIVFALCCSGSYQQRHTSKFKDN